MTSNSNAIYWLQGGYPLRVNITKNRIISNTYGIELLGRGGGKVIYNNTIVSNNVGLWFHYVNDTIVSFNRLERNDIGIKFENSGGTIAQDNWIHHNNILYNKIQAQDAGTNYYDDDHGQGNYWSDYKGHDDGTLLGRKDEAKFAGDGIGDSLTPHLNLDYYPFMSESGWLNRLPTASAGVDLTGRVDVSIQFDGTASSDPDGTIISYDWDWGDGTIHGSGATPTHTYTTPGVYTVTLTVMDNKYAVAKDTLTVTVYVPPVVIAGGDQTLATGETGTFDGSGSYDPDGSIVSYDWDWGDGTSHGTDAISTHTYGENGIYYATLTVTDDDGVTSSETITVTVCDVPVIPELPDKTGVSGVPIAFDSSGANDPDGTIVSYDWDWGDGTPHGTGATPSHTYAADGVYEATLTVTDSQGMTASSSFTVTVYDAPVIPELEDRTGESGVEMDFDASGASDPDGYIVSYDWDWGDGTAHGTGATPSHTYADNGVYDVTLTVTDDDGVTS